VPGAQNVTVVDRRTRTVTAKWSLSAAANFPMALDEVDHRLFIGCRNPATLLVLDASSGKQVGSLDIVGDTDDLFYDAELKRIYISGGAGAVTVVQQKGSDAYSVLATIPTAERARTSLFVPAWKRLFVAAPKHGKEPARLFVYATE
jgi:outer membrane protein assembly factor BamB